MYIMENVLPPRPADVIGGKHENGKEEKVENVEGKRRTLGVS
jgi:hypothetical protein